MIVTLIVRLAVCFAALGAGIALCIWGCRSAVRGPARFYRGDVPDHEYAPVSPDEEERFRDLAERMGA